MSTEGQCLNIAQAAEKLSVSGATIRRLISAGRLPHVRVGRQWRVPVQGLSEWIAQGGCGLASPADVSGRRGAGGS